MWGPGTTFSTKLFGNTRGYLLSLKPVLANWCLLGWLHSKFSVLRCDFNSIFVYGDVYNSRSDVLLTTFRRDADPTLSDKTFLIDCTNLHLLCEEDNTIGIGSIPNLGVDILRRGKMEEVPIDSTFKTEKTKYGAL